MPQCDASYGGAAHLVATALGRLRGGFSNRPIDFLIYLPSNQELNRGRFVGKDIMTKHRIYTMSFAKIYPFYISKAEKKGRTKKEVDEIIRWLTGYSQKELEAQLENQTNCETFITEAPRLNPSRALIKGKICGVRVED